MIGYRKGDISTLILVIGVFLVCAVAIFSFVFLNDSDKEKFANTIGNMALVNSIAEKIRFYENAGQNPLDFLDVTKNGNEYNITINEMDGEERLFGVQYIIKTRVQPSQ